MEKGIYTEETVGDLAQAIEVYREVVAQGKAAQQVAAQAQLRIGLCLAKLGKTDEATTAFQAVIDNFPEATDIVAQARQQLPSEPKLLPVPWGQGDEMLMEMKLPNGMGAGLQVYRVHELEQAGQKHWECQSWQTVTLNGAFGQSRVLADYETYAPQESRWRHSMLGSVEAVYDKDQVVIQVAGQSSPTTLKFSPPAFDNEQAAELFRRLPLEVGYKSKITVISTLATTKVPLDLEVPKIETIDVPAGSFECYRLELSIGQTFWISTDESRYLVQFRAGGVTAGLMQVRQPAEFQASTNVEDSRYSLTLPPDWFAYKPSGQAEDASPTTALLDPSGIANTRIEIGPLEPIQEKHATPEAWLKASLEQYRERMQDFKLVEPGVETTTVGGRPAATATVTFVEGNKPMTARRMTIFGETSAANLRFAVETARLAEWEPQFAEILQTLEVK